MTSPVVDLFGVPQQPRRAMGSHDNNSAGHDEWLTPPEVIGALGSFDLDPCSPVDRPWPTAREHYTIADNGLTLPWHGLVWVNPPYSTASKWLAKLSAHGDGIALLFARTETQLFFRHVWPHATALLFLEGRLHFHYANGRRAGNSGAPSVLVAYGDRAAEVLAGTALAGQLVSTSARPHGNEAAA
jgi:hypothetical protein